MAETLTFDQQRALDAREKALAVKNDRSVDPKEYRSYVNALPATILTNGLGQAMATELAAAGGSGGAHQKLYEHLNNWLCGEDKPYPHHTCLMDAITNGKQADYVRAQAEAMAWLNWHKKFCRAYLPKENDS